MFSHTYVRTFCSHPSSKRTLSPECCFQSRVGENYHSLETTIPGDYHFLGQPFLEYRCSNYDTWWHELVEAPKSIESGGSYGISCIDDSGLDQWGFNQSINGELSLYKGLVYVCEWQKVLCCLSQHYVKYTSSASHIFFANVCIRFLSICRMCILITFSCAIGLIYCIYTTLLQFDYVPISHMPISNKYYRTLKNLAIFYTISGSLWVLYSYITCLHNIWI